MQIDLSDRKRTAEAIEESAAGSMAGGSMRWSITPASRPRGRRGERLNSLTTPEMLWMGARVNFLAPLLLARGCLRNSPMPEA